MEVAASLGTSAYSPVEGSAGSKTFILALFRKTCPQGPDASENCERTRKRLSANRSTHTWSCRGDRENMPIVGVG